MRLLDLFCCAGGAAMGYHRAGFEVVGVDISPQHALILKGGDTMK
jgi:DNA (cytosine-5)-methyltransferase 1